MRSCKHLGIGWGYFLQERFCDVVAMVKLANDDGPGVDEMMEDL